MIITDYYLLKELKPMKSHRLDCTASTGGYEPFEAIAQRSRAKRFFCYYNGVPDTFKADAKRKADQAITNSNNISSVYTPDLENRFLGFGDTKNTNDALLFKFAPDYKQLEIFVCRGYKNNKHGVFNLFLGGELDAEIGQITKSVTVIK